MTVAIFALRQLDARARVIGDRMATLEQDGANACHGEGLQAFIDDLTAAGLSRDETSRLRRSSATGPAGVAGSRSTR